MTERGILFSAPMVRALLDGSKTQTRRAVKPQPPAGHDWAGWCTSSTHRPDEGKATWAIGEGALLRDSHRVRCPYGQPGDRLWVRETFIDLEGTGIEHRDANSKRRRYAFREESPPGSYSDDVRKEYGLKWTPSIHMPRAASRILLEITGVRVERLQDISDEDAIAEGISRVGPGWERWHPDPADTEHTGSTQDPRLSYRGLWENINGAGSWDANPWVWVVEFKRIEA